MNTVIFTKDFATKKKGDEFTCDGMLASHLVRIDKVAKFKSDKPKSKAKK